jgi:cobalamin biosynthesis protein CobD/CbiB
VERIANACVKAGRTVRHYFEEKAYGYGLAFFILCIVTITLVPAQDLHDLTFSSPVIFAVFFLGYLFGGGEIAHRALAVLRRKEESHEQIQHGSKFKEPDC